jgi:hypothetical protein
VTLADRASCLSTYGLRCCVPLSCCNNFHFSGVFCNVLRQFSGVRVFANVTFEYWWESQMESDHWGTKA